MANKEKKIQIPKPVMVDPKLLKLHPKNVKKHDEKQLHDLGVLYEMIGFTDPIIADNKNVVWAGNGSLEEALRKNMALVPVVYIPDEWTKDQKKIFMLMDNKITESPWEFANFKLLYDAVSPQLGELFQADFTKLVDLTNLKLNIIVPEKGELPEPPAKPKSKLDDIYQLGNHRILCGDCSKKPIKLLGNKTVDLLLTDPPYGVDIANKNEYLNYLDNAQGFAGNRIERTLTNDDIKDYEKFFRDFLSIIPFSEINSCYVFMSDQKIRELLNILDELKFKLGNLLIWKKNSGVFSRKDYHSQHEIITYFWKDKHKFYGDYFTTIIEVDRPLKNKEHPTMKPLAILIPLINNSSKNNSIVYDPFLGSGSTLIACEQTNRICYGIEIDPAYIDVVITRWENYTGKKAKLL